MEVIKLKVVEYRIPIEIKEDLTFEEKIESQEEIDSYNLTLLSALAIGEEARKVAAFNERQIEYVKTMPGRTFILKRIIINNNQ